MATISSFREALANPQRGFRRMARLHWRDGRICRSTYFAEAEVECGAERYMIFMPLASSSLKRVERIIPLHRHLITSYVPRMEILRGEMCVVDSVGREAKCDILREIIPAGEPFADALAAVADEHDAELLLKAVDELQGALLCADMSHNAVREENIIINERGEARLVRWYYATERAGNDREAFDRLRDKILTHCNVVLRDSGVALYNVETTFENHLYVRPMHEGLAAVEEPTGWGFVDSANRFVIEPAFRWVGDFSEGRAEVETAEGMGVINRDGDYIVPAVYDSVEYDSRSGKTRAWQGAECFLFDYEGHAVECDAVYPPPCVEEMC